MIKLLCFLFGHTGKETESGFHVCSRCGLHEYHCHEEYSRAGYLFRPIYWIKYFLYNSWYKMKRRYIIWKDRKYNDDVPF